MLKKSQNATNNLVVLVTLDEGEVTEETLTVTFPNTAVLYLWTYKKTPDKMKYVIVTPGGTVRYDVPIMKVQTYSLDDIFEKRSADADSILYFFT
ncbi:MAG: hypothetical protein K2N80_16320 [Lachnospiraceae bacterium]|nr:hypothetical protein [Lachnospiraceae bacterium]